MSTTDETYDTDVVMYPGWGSPSDASVFQRVLAIIDELPAIGKTQRNEQQKFMFRGHDDVMNALNPLLAKHGVFVVPNVIDRKVGERQTSRGATMYEVNLHVEFTFFGKAGDSFTASGWGEGTDMGDKATSKAMTMAFKYVIAEVFALATAEVSDADAGSPEETSRGDAAAAAPRGRSEGSERKPREFDVARDLAPGAIKVQTEEDADSLRRVLVDVDPEQPWNEIEEYVILHVFDKPYEELSGAEKREFYTRFANAVIRLDELSGPGDFPPPTLDQVRAAWAWAFKGVSLALDEPVPDEEPEPDEEPPGDVSGA